MLRRVARRLGGLVFVLVATSALSFLLLHAAPGDPIDALAANLRQPTPERRAALGHELGLDRPLPEQLVRWCGRTLVFDFGRSTVDGRPVLVRVGEALPSTLWLTLLTLGWAYAAGIALALVARRPAIVDVAAALTYALPVAGVGLVLLVLGAPYGGGWAFVPASLALGLAVVSSVASQQKAALAETMAQPFVVVHAARGVAGWALLVRALRASLAPTLTLFGSHLPSLLSGALVVEVLFGLHGVGRIFVESVYARDLPMVMGLLTLSAAAAVMAGWLADALLALADPRQRGAAA